MSDDWCIARMAQEMGKDDIYQKYIQRSQNYINVFDGKGSTQELAQAVVAEAIKHRNDGHDDDITVLAVKLTDNE